MIKIHEQGIPGRRFLGLVKEIRLHHQDGERPRGLRSKTAQGLKSGRDTSLHTYTGSHTRHLPQGRTLNPPPWKRDFCKWTPCRKRQTQSPEGYWIQNLLFSKFPKSRSIRIPWGFLKSADSRDIKNKKIGETHYQGV